MKDKKFSEILKKGHLPYWVGGILLGLLNIALAIIYKPWGITGDAAIWGIRVSTWLGFDQSVLSDYFKETSFTLLQKHPIFNEETTLNLGIIVGVFLAATLAGQFRIKPIRSPRQVLFALAGGLLMGYGARLSLGCNVGAMVGGIASQSVHGWVTGVFIFLGAFTASFLFRRG